MFLPPLTAPGAPACQRRGGLAPATRGTRARGFPSRRVRDTARLSASRTCRVSPCGRGAGGAGGGRWSRWRPSPAARCHRPECPTRRGTSPRGHALRPGWPVAVPGVLTRQSRHREAGWWPWSRRFVDVSPTAARLSCVAGAARSPGRGGRAEGCGGGARDRAGLGVGRGSARTRGRPRLPGRREAGCRPVPRHARQASGRQGAPEAGRHTHTAPNNALEPTAPMAVCASSLLCVARRLTAGR